MMVDGLLRRLFDQISFILIVIGVFGKTSKKFFQYKFIPLPLAARFEPLNISS